MGRRVDHAASITILLAALTACGDRKPEQEAASGTGKAAPEAVVNVYTWADYIDPRLIEDFRKSTGIQVRIDVFDTNRALETKLLTGNSGYDLVTPSTDFLPREIAAGALRKLDNGLLPNISNLDPEIVRRVAARDPGNEYAVPFAWGTIGIGYDAAKVEAIMPDAPVDSWKLIFDPAVLSRFESCGIAVLDAPGDMIPSTLLWLRKDPHSQSLDDLKLAENALLKIRPYLRTIHSSQYIDRLANGDLCIVVGYNGDVLQARARAAESGKPLDIRYSIPKEGAMMWFDMLAIPADAPHLENAHKLIDYLMRPEVAAANSNFTRFANANASATALIDESIRNDPGIYPTSEVQDRLQIGVVNSPEFSRALNRTWTRFMTGR